MIIEKESADKIFNGCTTVGTSRIPLASLGNILSKGVLIRAPGTNDPGGGNNVPVWVGNSTVSADNLATGGTPLLPGDSVFVPISLLTNVYVISSGTNQIVSWMAA